MRVEIPKPWLGFIRDVDRELRQPIEVHCLGGFVLAVLWNLPRPTGDVDIIEVRPAAAGDELMRIAGEGSELARHYQIHFQRVTVAEYPEQYVARLIDITPKRLHRLSLRALEAHDLALAKLGRNSPRDRGDVEFLAKKGALDPHLLLKRFEAEMRPYLLNEARETATLRLWLNEFFGIREK